MKKIAILQSNYIPWKGYFDIINSVDLFIFHDDLLFTSGDWRNRNRIKTEKGLDWLTIPCGKPKNRLICEVELKDFKWQKKHWAKIDYQYRKSKYFSEYKEFFKSIYLDFNWENLSDMNQFTIKAISKEILNIDTMFEDSRKYSLKFKKAERVIELLKKAKADMYLSGPAAKDYLSEEIFKKENIQIEWMDYGGYPEYTQLNPPFEHGVSILDLIFNEGSNATKYMNSFKSPPGIKSLILESKPCIARGGS